MGAIAQQAQGQQLQPLNPKGKLKQLVEHSWPQIARVIGGNLDSEALLQMCISSINRTPALADRKLMKRVHGGYAITLKGLLAVKVWRLHLFLFHHDEYKYFRRKK